MDWDNKASNYHDNFLSPFAPQMTETDQSGRCRNLLINHIRSHDSTFYKGKEIADFGSGPGNLIEFVANRFNHLTALDFSPASLAIARQRARQRGLPLTAIEADMCTFRPSKCFDIIISVNAILPPHRYQVTQMLETVAASLAPEGEFWAIMPSFDTTQRLAEYMQQDIATRTGKDDAAEAVKAFLASKLSDPATCSYADDGINPQCYHTPASMMRDFTAAGLLMQAQPEKVYYPWDLTRRFDYGFFPGKEEIWDYFVRARKVASQTPKP